MGLEPNGDRGSIVAFLNGRKNSLLSTLLLVTIIWTLYSGGIISPSDHVTPAPGHSPHTSNISSSAGSTVAGNRPKESMSSESKSLESAQSQHLLPAGPIPLAGGLPLRVMFLGASVTRGDVSIGNLGFRAPLRDRLAALGNPINFVGSQRLGTFIDNDLEAYPGNRVDQIHAAAMKVVPDLKPNVFVLHVGSNDCLQKHDTANIGNRMNDLVNYLFYTSPRATVIMSTLLTNTVPSKEPCILDINTQIRKLASRLQRMGSPVILAEMHCEQGLFDRPIPADISPDGTHPFDHGYGLMADIFYEAFIEADERKFLKTPEENGVPPDGEKERKDQPIWETPRKKKPTPAKRSTDQSNQG
ncbi:carbohydrate esterase family 3 protein [Xylariaceae sp. FL1272]|nr:carbohydrate esterase family 3 protein [Xylariaceae sp. FL1272]